MTKLRANIHWKLLQRKKEKEMENKWQNPEKHHKLPHHVSLFSAEKKKSGSYGVAPLSPCLTELGSVDFEFRFVKQLLQQSRF